MSGVFGIVVAGRPVITEMNTISETKFFAEIPNADDINHIVVFTTMPFPDGMGGAGSASDHPFGAHPTHIAQIGISVESLSDLLQQTPASNTAPAAASSFPEFAQKMVENFFNFVTSFSVSQAQMTPQPNEMYVPFKAVEQWYNNTKAKFEANPNFWRN